MAALQTWLDGKYKITWNGKIYGIASVDGEDATLEGPEFPEDHEEKGINKRKLKMGNFEETDQQIYDATGKRNYEVKIINNGNPEDEGFGVVTDYGKCITVKGSFGFTYTWDWIEEEEAKSVKDDLEHDMDPYESPPNHYTLRPGHVGKFIWLSGAPGFGKSTTARRMMETHGFVYYEGDCFFSKKNPYLPQSENSAIEGLLSAKYLKHVPKETAAIIHRSGKEWEKAFKGEDSDLSEVFNVMCENILKERKRVGGDWVVAMAVPNRKMRDLIKEKLGSELVFVVLNLDKDLQLERLEPRVETLGSKFNEILFAMEFEPVCEDEENTIDLKITRDMDLDEVVKAILDNISC
eukprot:GFUD01010104.1.p1 GENE.GFUD01010104.1~~GFUD01010104.1.p1  ORF type:complete len:351 (+),score=105.54 GFUD01010104.1:41-1093(+)